MSTAPADIRYDQAAIEADQTVPMIHIRRDFAGTPEQLFRAHTDPELFARWVGPDGSQTTILEWDATDNGKWRFVGGDCEDNQYFFRGSFHTVRPDRIVQTFTWEAMPDGVALETLTFEDLGDGRTRLHATSLCDSFEARDGWLASGMEVGVNDGYAKLDRMLADGAVDLGHDA
ncbi:MAG: SRPBCC family protein [Nocardioides sp.]